MGCLVKLQTLTCVDFVRFSRGPKFNQIGETYVGPI